jgi:hypothetical protein
MHPGKLAVLALLALAALAGCDESGPATGTFGGMGGGPGPAPSTLAIDTSSIPPAEHGLFYSAQFQASGGSGGYAWHFGYLPQPFTIPVSTGAVATIEGTPGYAGDFVFEVYVTDSLGAIAHASFDLHVGIGALVIPVIVTTTSMPDGTVGGPDNLQLHATGGAGGYTWSNLYPVDGLGILPAGRSTPPPPPPASACG